MVEMNEQQKKSFEILGEYLQVDNGVPKEVVDAYHHGVRSWVFTLACIANKEES